MEINELLLAIDQKKNELIELTQRLIQIPSENKPPTGYENKAQEYFADKHRELDMSVDLFNPNEVPGITDHHAYLKGRNYEDRPNVVSKLKGAGGGRSMILTGHMDTSPKEPMPWGQHGPFSGDIENDKIYGRGGFDMKGGLAASYMAVKAIVEAGLKLKGDVYLESVVDEEYGGANGTLACRLRGYEADAAILTECSCLAICPATRGDKNWKITLKGTPGMPYTGEPPTNPVYGMAKIIQALRKYEEIRNEKTEKHPLYIDDPSPLPVLIKKLKAGEVEPHGALGIPIDCWLLVGPQVYPGTSEEEFDKEFFGYMNEVVKSDLELQKNPPTYKSMFRYVEPTEIKRDHPIVKQVEKAYTSITGKPAVVKGAPFPCDGFIFNKFSETPVLVFGPGGANAHAPNEYVYIEDLVVLAKTLAVSIVEWCGLA